MNVESTTVVVVSHDYCSLRVVVLESFAGGEESSSEKKFSIKKQVGFPGLSSVSFSRVSHVSGKLVRALRLEERKGETVDKMKCPVLSILFIVVDMSNAREQSG